MSFLGGVSQDPACAVIRSHLRSARALVSGSTAAISATVLASLAVALAGACAGASTASPGPAAAPSESTPSESSEVPAEAQTSEVVKPLLGGSPSESVGAQDAAATKWAGRSDLIEITAAHRAHPQSLQVASLDAFKSRRGLKASLLTRVSASLLSVSLSVEAGTASEDPTRPGLAQLTAQVLAAQLGGSLKGGGSAFDNDFAGVSFDVDVGSQNVLLTCRALPTKWRLCLSELSRVTLRPRFDAQQMAKLARVLLDESAAVNQEPSALAQAHLRNLIFGDAHPQGSVVTPQSLESLRPDDVRTFWRSRYRPERAGLAIVAPVEGAPSARAVRRAVEQAFGRWRAPRSSSDQMSAEALADVPQRAANRILLVDVPVGDRALVLLGQAAPGLAKADAPAFTVLTAALAAPGFASRLLIELGARRKLAFDVAGSLDGSAEMGLLQIGFSTSLQGLWPALTSALEVLATVAENGMTASEVAGAQGFLAGLSTRRLETSQALSAAVAGSLSRGGAASDVLLGGEKLGSVSAEDLRLAAGAHLHPEKMVVVLMGEADRIAPRLRAQKVPFESVTAADPISLHARAVLAHTESTGGERAARALLARALYQQGGPERLRRLRPLRIEKQGGRAGEDGGGVRVAGITTYRGAQSARIEQTIVLTDGRRARSVVVVEDGRVTGGATDSRLEPLPAENAARIRAALFEDANFILLNALEADPPLPMRLVEPLMAGPVQMRGVELKAPAGHWVRLYFEPESGRLARIVSPDGEGGHSDERLADYREVDGFWFAHTQLSHAGGVVSSATVEKIETRLSTP